jgi:hypothetical protein
MFQTCGFGIIFLLFNKYRCRIRKDDAPENMVALRRFALKDDHLLNGPL